MHICHDLVPWTLTFLPVRLSYVLIIDMSCKKYVVLTLDCAIMGHSESIICQWAVICPCSWRLSQWKVSSAGKGIVAHKSYKSMLTANRCMKTTCCFHQTALNMFREQEFRAKFSLTAFLITQFKNSTHLSLTLFLVPNMCSRFTTLKIHANRHMCNTRSTK